MRGAFIVLERVASRADAPGGGPTPLERARRPHLDRLAREGMLGLARMPAQDLGPGADLAHAAFLGQDPRRCLAARAPIEATADGVPVKPGAVVFRLDLVATWDRKLVDAAPAARDADDARALLAALSAASWLGAKEKDLALHPGPLDRHFLTWDGWPDSLPVPETTPPEAAAGKPLAASFPRGSGAERLVDLMMRSTPILAGHAINKKRTQAGRPPANQVWLWGAGQAAAFPKLAERRPGGLRGAAISPSAYVRALASVSGLGVVPVAAVPGTGAEAEPAVVGAVALGALATHDLVYVHVAAPADVAARTAAIERIDAGVVGPIVAALEAARKPFRVLVAADRATSLASRGPAPDPVPFVLFGTGVAARRGTGFSEAAALETQGRVEPTAAGDLVGLVLGTSR